MSTQKESLYNILIMKFFFSANWCAFRKLTVVTALTKRLSVLAHEFRGGGGGADTVYTAYIGLLDVDKLPPGRALCAWNNHF